MAEPILRLRVESKEYDSKIKRAADGLLELENSCRKTQKSMADADKATVDYVRQIGRMETVNRTAKGSVNELQKTFVELSAQYNRLTEQEKRSPFGQALAKSIDDLKGRVQQGRQELDRINQSLNGTSSSGNKATGVLDSLAGKFGLNATQLVSFAGKLGVAKVALDVARDAFMASEANMDEWGAVVRSAQDVYQGFLNALNTSDISGFLGRINDIIAAARAAYDALDTLETAKIINSPRKSAKQAEIDRMRTMLQTGRYIAPNGQKPIMKEGTKLTEQQLANISKNLQSAVGNLNDITRSEIQLANTAIDRLYDEQAKVIGMSKQQFMAGTADMTTFSRNVEMGKRYKEFEAQHTSYGSQGSIVGHRDKAVNPYAAYRGWAEFSEGGKLYQGIVGLITQRDQQLSQMYSSIGSNYRRINAIQGFSPTGGGRGGGGHTGGGGGGTTVIPKTEQQLNSEAIAALNQEYISATAERREAIRGEIKTLQERNAEIQKLIDESNGKVEDKAIVGSVRDLNEQMAKLKKQQQDVTDTAEWTKLQGQMDGLQKRINGIMGVVEPDMSIFSNKNLQALTSSLKQQLDESNIGSELYDKLTGQLFDATAFGNLLSEFVKNGIDMSEIDAAGMWKKIFGGEDVATEELQKMLDKLNAYFAEHGLDLMQVNTDGSLGNVEKKDKKDPVDQVSKAVSGLSTIASGIQQTGVKLPPAITDAINVMQGVISVVQGVQTIISLFSNTTTTANTAALFANTAAVGALTTAMIANTATNIIPFKAGGIVHAATGLVAGHDFSDNTPVMVSSGELILNKAQQGNLAAQLEGGNGIGDLRLETKVSAEEFRVMLNSNSRRRGRGEYVTTRG